MIKNPRLADRRVPLRARSSSRSPRSAASRAAGSSVRERDGQQPARARRRLPDRRVRVRHRRERQRQVLARERGARQGAQPAPARPARRRHLRHASRARRQLDKLVVIDQSPIGRTPRSNPATYTGAFDLIRDSSRMTPEAKMRGYGPGRFSFNVKGGRCESCQGDGIIKIEMHFLPDVYVPCEVCKGKRYNAQTLEMQVQGQDRSPTCWRCASTRRASSSRDPAHPQPAQDDRRRRPGLHQDGPARDARSPAARRSASSSRPNSRSAPTGPHVLRARRADDGLALRRHPQAARRAAAAGRRSATPCSSIEHNLDVIKTADYLIDLGPEGGDRGGTIVATGTPERSPSARLRSPAPT